MLRELTSPAELSRSGRLHPEAVGWSRLPLHTCTLEGSPRWRTKRWNYWAFTTETHLFSVTVSDIGYAGLAFLYVADFEQRTFEEETVLVPFARGFDLPDTVDADVRFDHRDLSISMAHEGGQEEHRVVHRVHMPNFKGRPLHAELVVRYPANHDTLNVVVPWDDERFQFTAKHNTLPVEGTVQVDARPGEAPQEIRFGGPQAFACLDYGRGVWPYRCTWNWGAGSGRQRDCTVGLNLGGKWTDGTGSTENAVCIDGTLMKIHQDLVWEYDTGAWMKPWRIYTPGRHDVDLEFTPIMERTAITNALIIRSEVHQMFGHWNGVVRDVGDRPIEIESLIGWAEDHRAAW